MNISSFLSSATSFTVTRRVRCLLLALLLVCGGRVGQAAVVINEIHYDPDVKTDAVEFIELYNNGASSVNLGGWMFTDAVTYTFPNGTVLPAGGYLVIGQNPAAIQTKWGITGVLGPWTGKLSNDGDNIILVDNNAVKIDEVDYQCGFPWPTSSRGDGPSMELINPAFDNNLGGNWRPSGDYSNDHLITFFSEQSDWHYFKGKTEASTPISAWRTLAFSENSSWTTAMGPLGYAKSYVMTNLADMKNGYTTVYLRKTFTVADAAAVSNLVLQALYDDGINVWINGKLVYRENTSSDNPLYNATAITSITNDAYREIVLPDPSQYIVTGTNIIAVQLLNQSIGGSDACFDARLINTASKKPTPGAINSVYNTSPPPCLRQVDCTPAQPTAGQAVTISIKATAPSGIQSVKLQYQTVDPGTYIRLSDPEWTSGWSADQVMHDDGAAGDAAAGDDIYTFVIPGAVQTHRRLVRYRITATAQNGKTIAAPYSDDPQYNFAYYCYNGLPSWTGAIDPGTNTTSATLKQPVTFDAGVLGSLPVVQLLSRNADVLACQYTGPVDGIYHYEGAIVFGGVVYDHLFYRIKGAASTRVVGKNKWKFNFTKGHALQMVDNYGNKYPTRWDKLIFSTGTCPWWSEPSAQVWNVGTEGMVLNEMLGMRLFGLAGVPSSHATFLHYRVVDDPLEANPATQYDGDFWGLYIGIEQPDGDYLDSHDLPDGNSFKMAGSGSHALNQGPAQPSDLSDLNAFTSNVTGYNKSNPYQTVDWYRTNLNLDDYYRFKIVSDAINNADRRPEWNVIYYHHPVTGQWWIFPWDLDLTFDYAPHYADMEHWRYLLSYPALNLEYQNAARELQDLLLNSDEGGRVVDELAAFLTKGGSGHSFFDASRAMWEWHPRIVAKYKGNFFKNNPFLDYLGGRSFSGEVAYWKQFFQPQGVGSLIGFNSAPFFGGSLVSADDADTSLPGTPQLTYIGAPGYPSNDLRFQSSNYSGSAAFAAMKWRIGEVTDKNSPAYNPADWQKFEVSPLWDSGEITTFNNQIRIPSTGLKVGHAYRARVRMKDVTGRWSHWSAPLQFTLATASNAVTLSDALRITELMYDPPLGDTYEFVELKNISATDTLDLTGLTFTKGISYSFPSGATLAPGAYLLLTRAADLTAFKTYYNVPAGVAVYAPYTGKFDNQGEEVELKTSAGGTVLVDFTYDNSRGWPLASQSGGHSMVPQPSAIAGEPGGSLDYGGNWKASAFLKGSPGRDEPATPASIMLNELNAHTDPAPPAESNDWIELYNPTAAPVTLDANWFLSDDLGNLRKYSIGAMTIAAGGFKVLDETAFHPSVDVGFGLNKAGERILLSYLPGTAQDRIVDSVRFEGQENGPTTGRYPNAAAWWYVMDPSLAATNTAPRAVPVINEVMYHPDDDTTATEYIELYNPLRTPVDLWTNDGAVRPWRISGAVNYTFPVNTTIQAGEYIVLVAFPPSDTTLLNAFKSKYANGTFPTGVRFFGPYAGGMSNKVGRLSLEKAQGGDPPDPATLISWIVVDELLYFDQNPFPPQADGAGSALQRQQDAQSGWDPANWKAMLPSPGQHWSGAVGAGSTALLPVRITTRDIQIQVFKDGGQQPSVTLYWGTANGGKNAAAWQHTANLGPQSGGTFTTTISALTPGTDYYFTCSATYAGGVLWQNDGPLTFQTASMTVSNAAASGIGVDSASLGGSVHVDYGNYPTLTIFYGTVDGGTNAASWQSSVNLGPDNGGGDYASNLTGLLTNTKYYYRCRAICSGATVWATASATFQTKLGYTLTVNILGGGTVTQTPKKNVYTPGDTVKLTANPNTGMVFSRWQSGVPISLYRTNPVTLTMTGNNTVLAVFGARTAAGGAWTDY